MRVHFRVMTPVEAWVREGNRMWWCKALAFVVGGYGALAASLRALLWALDVEREEEVPDSLCSGNFRACTVRLNERCSTRGFESHWSW